MKISDILIESDDYRGEHRAPDKSGGAPLHDLSNIYPDDIYGPNAAQYYGHYGQNNPMDVDSIRKIQMMRGKPRRGISIYRAVPKGVKSINPGDWVTISKEYAKEHGESTLDGKYTILHKIVNAGQLYTDGNSIHEWGYDPS
jgi:hypothetical protein